MSGLEIFLKRFELFREGIMALLKGGEPAFYALSCSFVSGFEAFFEGGYGGVYVLEFFVEDINFYLVAM